MKARYYLKENVIYLSITLRGKRVRYSTQLTIDSKKWSNGYPLRSQTLIREQLNEINALMDSHLATKEVTPLSIKQVVDKWINKGVEVNTLAVSHLIDMYINEKKSKVKSITLSKVTTDLNDFKSFKVNKEVSDLNKQFLKDYKTSLSLKQLEASTLNNYIKNLKAFLRWLYVNDHTTTDLSKYVTKFEAKQKEIIAINEMELQQLEQHTNKKGEKIELSNKHKRIVDSFLFGCYTGLRYSDLSRVAPAMIENEVLTIRQQKTGNVVVIPLISEALNILKRNKGLVPTISHQKANEYIKEVFTLLQIDRQVVMTKQIGNTLVDSYQPLNEVISYHIGRKSFITIALSRGIHAKIVQAISGHKKDEIFNKYIAFSSNTLKEQMSKMSLSSRSLKAVV